jgi:hypothetical protein
MLKYLTKFAMDVLPSVVATILGAYIVNHYVNAKSDAPTAALMSPADLKNQKNETAKNHEPGVKAKGISERAMIEKSASEGPAEVKPVESKPVEAKPTENKPAESKPELKPSETASAPAEPRRASLAPREKAVAKVTPAPLTPSPATATANAAPAAEGNSTSEERRDANDLARAAIERLRGTAANSRDANRQPESPTSPERTVGVSPVRPLPPPIAVATPPAEGGNAGAPPYTASIRNDDPNRPTPPAEIPTPPPLDLRAAANEATNAKDRAKAVAEDMLSAAKSMFHTVLPQ